MNPRSSIHRPSLFHDLGYVPHAGQWELHNSTATHRVVACGVRWGKTRAAAMEAIVAALEPRKSSIGWIVAPTYDLCDRVFREIQVILLEKLYHHVIAMKESERRVILRNLGGGTSEIRGKSADNPTSLLGEGLDFCIVDEAARLKPDIWESHLTQRLVDKRGWALLISTPRGKGYFYELFLRGQSGNDPAYASWNYPSWTNPHLDRTIIEAERVNLPDRVFAQEYGGQFIEGSGAVFRNVRECATGTFEEKKPGVRYAAGLDLAKVEDYTVMVVVSSEKKVVFVDRFNKVDWQFQLLRVISVVEKYDLEHVLVDVTGVGDPIYEALIAAGCPALPYPFTKASKNALIANLVLLLERKGIVLPSPKEWPVGIEELESFQYSVSDSGNVRASAPSGRHDDCVISLALAAWNLRQVQRRVQVAELISLEDLRRGRIPGVRYS